MNDLYERIRLFRKKRRMTQDELAIRLGYTSRSSIAKIEAGEVDLPQSKIKAFADALGVSPGVLMGWSDGDGSEKYLLSEEEGHLLDVFRVADPVYQKVAVDILEAHPAGREEEKEGYA